MAFVDELTIYAKAGDGGDGVVRWLHLKFDEFAGPAGGDGGNGGDVYIKAVRNVHLLSKYRSKKRFIAGAGGEGKSRSLHGSRGEDLEIELPIGCVVTNLRTKRKYSLDTEGETIKVLKGGEGGRGNESFKSSTNRSPQESTPGTPGEEADFHIELQLIADVGLVGLPNAGKSTLLNELTNAKSKTGAYPFTTLEPNLGEMFGYILADIPGLIEGASSGKGLGHKFLRHVKRTSTILHLVSLENEDPYEAYQSIRKELGEYDEELTSKREIIILTKTDVVSDQQLNEVIAHFASKGLDTVSMSAYDDSDIKRVRDFLSRQLGVARG